jgi:hypothetical protein
VIAAQIILGKNPYLHFRNLNPKLPRTFRQAVSDPLTPGKGMLKKSNQASTIIENNNN